MDMKQNDTECIFETEASWGNGKIKMLCLESGTWRTARPEIESDTCNRCGICYVYCPPQCIRIDEKEENFVPDLTYCKGCGVCAKECPKNAIIMKSEGDYNK